MIVANGLAGQAAERTVTVSGHLDPWHLVSGATEVFVDSVGELSIVAGLAGVPVNIVSESGAVAAFQDRLALCSAFAQAVTPYHYLSPFTGERVDLREAIELLGFWRGLVDSNRDIGSALGFAFWKQPTVAPLLWGGSGPVPFHRSPQTLAPGARVAAWKSRVSPRVLNELERTGAEPVEVEDGFIRSAGLGADCVPPLSIIVDRIGIHFDPTGPSELEELLQNGEFGPDLLGRAGALRRLIIDLGVSKYDSGPPRSQQRRSDRRHILVPGQVEDDRAVLAAGDAAIGNAELLRRVREDCPNAYIIYKPHPDVEAGHRLGALPDGLAAQLADELARDGPISSWIELVDEVHVNSSLAGFEALLRHKEVTTHGAPFYAGWGLTRDLGSVPERRTARRTLDELVAAALLLYPRYLDPVTRLPCPPEILVRRLAEGGAAGKPGSIVRLRRLQGRLKQTLALLRFR